MKKELILKCKTQWMENVVIAVNVYFRAVWLEIDINAVKKNNWKSFLLHKKTMIISGLGWVVFKSNFYIKLSGFVSIEGHKEWISCKLLGWKLKIISNEEKFNFRF